MYISSCKYCTAELHAQILTHPCPEEYPGFYSTKNTANECKALCFLWYNNDIMGTVQIFASTTLILYLDQLIKVVEQIVFWISFFFFKCRQAEIIVRWDMVVLRFLQPYWMSMHVYICYRVQCLWTLLLILMTISHGC